ncbi:hypothetical protein HHI36_000226 [Cryptolaemus montrouzieri]|uniref:protein-tyrosine-phosphatase n=1 Tax=Cryptolaemus montrouzieri TaxID=559131 RepID=A0ABD2P547_9CUCU
MRSSFRKRILEETAIYSSKSFDLTEDLSYEDLEKLDEMSFKVTSKVENSQTNTVANTTTSIYSMRIEVSTFEEYVKRSIENGEFERQHALLPKGHLYPHNYGLLPENQPKNRYKNLYPYDHSRVKLKIAREEYSDYINANYINGYKVEKAYIATQGPKKNTIEDFWRMIWQEKVKFIVMLANLIENKQNSVDKYWPDGNKGILFDDIYVHHQSTEFFCDYEYRIFVLSCNNETRKVEQLHFTSWPDNRIPLYSHTLSSIMKKMLKMHLSAEHPIVVHCSGGVGRTGTVILSDICLRMAGKEGAVDILNTLQKLRENRLNMVDNVEQYKLAHLVVLESLMGLSTSLACNHQLENNLRQLMNGKFRSEQEYLKQIEWQDEVMKSVAENSGNFMNYPEKNRIPEIIPEPQSRIILSKYPETDSSSSYINAIKIHGFGYQKRVIVTQQPLPHTLGDFWRLIVEQRTSIIVSLNEVDTQNQTSIHFWPTEAKPTLQPVDFLEVTFDRVINFDHYDIYTVNVLARRGEEKTMDVDVFAFKRWPVKDPIPLNCEEFINFMEEVDSKISQNILVTCFDGVSASGVYVALSLLIYKMKIELICDICLAVRTARHDRKQFINDDRQFFFLYEAAIAFNKMCQGSAKLK